MLKTDESHKFRLEKKVPVLTIDEIEGKIDVETKFFDEEPSCREQPGNAMDSDRNEIQPPD